MYGIHSSFYPLLISLSIQILILLFWIHFNLNYFILPLSLFLLLINSWSVISVFWSVSYSSFNFNFSIILLFILLIMWLFIIYWLVDYYIECFMGFTMIEQMSVVIGIKLLLISEFMLFIACFWAYINFRIVGSVFLLFQFPLLPTFTYAIPFSNLLILVFSSLPIQSTQLLIKFGNLNYSIEGLGQTLAFGFCFILMQCKEFFYSYFSLSDCFIGSIYYFTTGLHGVHVILGSLLFYFILFFLTMYSSTVPFYCTESTFNLFLSSYYWHFVDFIWFIVFLLIIM